MEEETTLKTGGQKQKDTLHMQIGMHPKNGIVTRNRPYKTTKYHEREKKNTIIGRE